MVLNVCNDPQFLEIMVIVKRIINIIKVFAPIVLIIMMMVDIIKSVTAGNAEGISKSMRQIPNRLLAAAMIFLVPTILEFTLNFVDDSFEYAACITNADYEIIQVLYTNNADNYVIKVEQSLNEGDLASARYAVNLLTDESLKISYNARLDKVAKKIESSKPTPSVNTGYNNSSGNVDSNKTFPYYNQCDSRWKKISLNNGSTYNTCNCGCGYASLAMIISGLNNAVAITPKTVVPYVITFSYGNCAISDAALYNSEKLKSKYGVTPTVLFYRNDSLSDSQKKQKIVEALKAKKPVIVLVPAHYVVLTKINGDQITVLDPGNSSNNGTYTIDSLFKKYYNHKNRCTEQGLCGIRFAISYSK